MLVSCLTSGQCGANSNHGVTFSSTTDPAGGVRRGVGVEDARTKAEELASGLTLGSVGSMLRRPLTCAAYVRLGDAEMDQARRPCQSNPFLDRCVRCVDDLRAPDTEPSGIRSVRSFQREECAMDAESQDGRPPFLRKLSSGALLRADRRCSLQARRGWATCSFAKRSSSPRVFRLPPDFKQRSNAVAERTYGCLTHPSGSTLWECAPGPVGSAPRGRNSLVSVKRTMMLPGGSSCMILTYDLIDRAPHPTVVWFGQAHLLGSHVSGTPRKPRAPP